MVATYFIEQLGNQEVYVWVYPDHLHDGFFWVTIVIFGEDGHQVAQNTHHGQNLESLLNQCALLVEVSA